MNYSATISTPRVSVPMPPAPRRIAETGLSAGFLVDLLVKTMFRNGLERPSQMCSELKLSRTIIEQLIEIATAQQLIELLGQPNANFAAEMRYQLTTKGRDWARSALEAGGWIGPTPVPLDQFIAQMEAQSIRREQLTEGALRGVFGKLTLAEEVMHKIGPAVNSGQSILLYGPPGNGKSSIANAICTAFGTHVFLPHAISVGGDVITFFDSSVHRPVQIAMPGAVSGLRRPQAMDERYVPCMRPAVVTGGELSIDKLDLRRNQRTELYDAPLQIKAAGGIFVVDDFGRQRHEPQELINRLIIPLECGTEHLVLDSGRKVELPFDTLVIFSTNFEPRSIMDEAGLRRLRHKILIDRPDRKTFVRILVTTAHRAGVKLDEETLAYILLELYGKNPTARFNAFHAPFLVEQCRNICSYRNIPPQMSREVLDQAWQNLMAAH